MSKQIISFDPKNLALVQQRIQQELDKIVAEFDLEAIRLQSTKYARTYFRTTIEATVKAENSPILRDIHLEQSQLLGFSASIIGQHFTHHGNRFKVVAINLNRPKFPIEVLRVADNKPFKFTAKGKIDFEDKTISFTANPVYAS